MYFRTRGWWAPVLLAMVFLAGGVRADAQATFSVSSSASTVIRTGHTELLGPMTFTVDSGTTVSGDIEISLSPAVLTSVESGIMRSWSGTNPVPMTTVSMSADEGLVTVTVPANINSGASLTVTGLRISVPNSGIENLEARISTTGNRLRAGQNVVQVIARAVDAIVVDPSSDTVYTYNSNRLLVDGLGSLTFEEGFPGAFSDDTMTDGRTAATQVIFHTTALPENTQLTFPHEIMSQTGAKLTTMSDGDEAMGVTISDSSPRNRIVYTFSSMENTSAATTIDVFSFRPTLAITGTPGSGTGFYQMTIGPIGAAPPTDDLPSEEVPRYDELLLPVLSPDLPASKDFLFPVQRGADTQEFAISNTTSGVAQLTLRAFDEAGVLLSGADITNETARLLSSNQTLKFDLTEMFGQGATTETVASVEISSRNDRTVATTIGRSENGEFATHPEMPISPAFFPFERQNRTQIPVLSVANAEMTADATFTLRTADGVELSSVTRSVEAGGAVREPLDTLFEMTPTTLPLSGYVELRAPETTFRGGLLDHPGGRPDAVPALLATGRTRIVFPFFVVGGGFNTTATLINTEAVKVAFVTLTAFDETGTQMGDPFMTQIQPMAQAKLDLDSILGPGGSRRGYFVLGIGQAISNPFASIPRLAGMVRIALRGVSAVTPVLNDTGEEFFFTPTRSEDSEYTGFTILNTSSLPMDITIEAYAANGTLLDKAGTLDAVDTEDEEAEDVEEEMEEVITIAGRSARIGLLREFLPDLDTQEGGYVRVASTTTRMSMLVFQGRMDLTKLLFLRRQTAP